MYSLKVNILFIVFLLGNCLSGLAQSAQGPYSGGTFANNARAGSSASWLNVSNALSSDDSYVGIPLNSLVTSGEFTDYLYVTNFGFSIPALAIVDGIKVEIERKDVNNAKDDRISIIQGGTLGTENKSKTAAWNTEAYFSYGGSTDLWSESWGPSDINSTDFGVAVSVRRQGGGANPIPELDHVRITVYYTEPLGVDLQLFTAKVLNKEVELSWLTESEINSDEFILERSTDSLEWVELSRVQGAGSSSETILYQYTDSQPVEGLSYYRLSQKYINGQREYFKPISIYAFFSEEILIFPNPGSNRVFISLPELNGNEIGSLYNLGGEHIKSFDVHAESMQFKGSFSLDISDLKPGLYYVKIGDSVQKLIKK